MTEDTVADAGLRAAVTRNMVLVPLGLGTVLLLAAVGFTVAGDDLSFFPFLLMLIGGFCFGFAFVNATLRMVPARSGAMLHIAAGIVLGALMIFMTEYGGDLLASLNEQARGVVLVLQMAAIPATGWIWLGLISRVTTRISRRDAKKRPPPVTREWVRDDSGDGSVVRFPGIPMRMRTLTWAIATVTVTAGLACLALLIAFDDIVMRAGARLAIIVLGVLVALPLYLLFTAIVRRHTEACTVVFGNDELRVRVGAADHAVAFQELEYLCWRARSEYARIEVRGAGIDLSLIAGLAKPPRGFSTELPELPRRVSRRLELAGFIIAKTRHGEVITFRRQAPAA